MADSAPSSSNDLPPEIHLEILKQTEWPSDVFAYINAVPAAAGVYFDSQGSFLKSWLPRALSDTAISTSLRIHRIIKSNHTISHTDLCNMPPFDGKMSAISTDELRALFHLSVSHEGIVKHCLVQPWLYENRAAGEFLERLEKPNKAGSPLTARLYSGFFIFEFWLHIEHIFRTSGGSSFAEWIALWYLQCTGSASTPALVTQAEWVAFHTALGDHNSNWCEADLAVDMDLAYHYIRYLRQTFKENLASSDARPTSCTTLRKIKIYKRKKPGLNYMEDMAIRRSNVICKINDNLRFICRLARKPAFQDERWVEVLLGRNEETQLNSEWKCDLFTDYFCQRLRWLTPRYWPAPYVWDDGQS